MPYKQTMARITLEIESGDLETALSRLYGLVATYRDNMLIRKMIGDVNFQLDNVREAGRWWYLLKAKNGQMQTAIELFEKSCGNNPLTIGKRLKFRGCISAVRKSNEFAAEKLLRLHQEVLEKHNYKLFCIQHTRDISLESVLTSEFTSFVNWIQRLFS